MLKSLGLRIGVVDALVVVVVVVVVVLVVVVVVGGIMQEHAPESHVPARG